jgi:hypothetical protein
MTKEQALTPFGEAIQEIGDKRGLSLAEVMELTVEQAMRGDPNRIRARVWTDLRAMVFVEELKRHRATSRVEELPDEEHFDEDVVFGHPN